MYNEEMIEDVREYLIDNDWDLVRECLECIGEDADWIEVYSLYDLYREYCNGELDEVINLFVDSGMNATSYYRYYILEGEVKDEDDMCYDIEEILDDDDIVTQIIAEIDYGNVNVPDELYKMCHVTDWEQVKEDIQQGYDSLLKSYAEQCSMQSDMAWFECHAISFIEVYRVYSALMVHNGFAKSADDFELLKGMAWHNALGSIADFAKRFAVGGVTIEKATEVWIKKNVLEG